MTRCQIKFVLVNGRTPASPSLCVLCCKPIGMGYLREIATELSYCDASCYANHRKNAFLAWHPLARFAAHEAAS